MERLSLSKDSNLSTRFFFNFSKNLSRYCCLRRFFLFLSDFFDRFAVNLERALQEGIGKRSQKENKDAKYEYRDRFKSSLEILPKPIHLTYKVN